MHIGLRSRTAIWTVFIATMVLCLSVGAQETPRVEVFGGYALTKLTRPAGAPVHPLLNGWDSELIFNATPNLGVVADFGGYYGTPKTLPSRSCSACPITPGIEIPTKVHTFTFGPQLSIRKGHFRPFGHALFGGAHLSVDLMDLSSFFRVPPPDSGSGFAMALGAGLDTFVTERFAWRVQADYLSLNLNNVTHKDFRAATGVVFRFGAH